MTHARRRPELGPDERGKVIAVPQALGGTSVVLVLGLPQVAEAEVAVLLLSKAVRSGVVGAGIPDLAVHSAQEMQ